LLDWEQQLIEDNWSGHDFGPAAMVILTRKIAETEGIDEALKANDQLGWVQRMNNIRNRAEEIIVHDMVS